MYADHASTALPVLFPAAAEPVTAAYGHARVRPISPGRRWGRAPADSPGPAFHPPPAAADSEPRLGVHFIATSGGTEANNLVLLQPDLWSFVMILPTEHHAVTLPAEFMSNHHQCELVYLTPTAFGGVDPVELRDLLRRRRDRTGLVSIATVNKEIGTVADLETIGSVVAAENRERADGSRRVWLHTDAVQAPDTYRSTWTEHTGTSIS